MPPDPPRRVAPTAHTGLPNCRATVRFYSRSAPAPFANFSLRSFLLAYTPPQHCSRLNFAVVQALVDLVSLKWLPSCQLWNPVFWFFFPVPSLISPYFQQASFALARALLHCLKNPDGVATMSWMASSYCIHNTSQKYMVFPFNHNLPLHRKIVAVFLIPLSLSLHTLILSFYHFKINTPLYLAVTTLSYLN